MSKLSSYSKPLNLGHKFLDKLWDGIVYVQEKVDGTLYARSRKQNLIVSPDTGGMFGLALQTVLDLESLLIPGYTNRGEFLSKPKHNSLRYDRAPDKYIIIYDVDKGDQDYMEPDELANEANRIGLLSVPLLASYTEKPNLAEIQKLLGHTSILDGVDIEGVVLKNYGQIGSDGKILMAKLVSEAFKEHHRGDWKKRNPNKADVINRLIDEFATHARWNKSIQHLSEQEKIKGIPQDIPILIREIVEDILEEHAEYIAESLMNHFRWQLGKGFTRGFPEYYKHKLLQESMGETCAACDGRGFFYGSETIAEPDPSDPTGQTPMPVQVEVQITCEVCQGSGKMEIINDDKEDLTVHKL